MLSTHLARLRDSLALWADDHPLASVEADANGVEFIRSNCLERFDEWVTPDFRKAMLQLQVAGHDGPANTLADAYGQCREFARRLDGLFADCLPVAPQYASEDAPFAIWTAEHGELDWLKCLAALGYAGAGPCDNLLAVAEEIETATDELGEITACQPAPPPRLAINQDAREITLDGKTYSDLDPDALTLFAGMLSAYPEPFQAGEVELRPNRINDKLPPALRYGKNSSVWKSGRGQGGCRLIINPFGK